MKKNKILKNMLIGAVIASSVLFGMDVMNNKGTVEELGYSGSFIDGEESGTTVKFTDNAPVVNGFTGTNITFVDVPTKEVSTESTFEKYGTTTTFSDNNEDLVKVEFEDNKDTDTAYTDTTYKKEVYIVNENYDKETTAEIKEAVSEMPDRLYRAVKDVPVEVKNVVIVKNSNYSSLKNKKGSFSGKTVYSSNEDEKLKIEIKKDLEDTRRTFYHEAAHCFDYDNETMKSGHYSLSDRFLNIYNKEWKNNSKLYGAITPNEAFAESVASYYLPNDAKFSKNFKEEFPESYAYIEELMLY